MDDSFKNKLSTETRKVEDKLTSNERLLENHNEKVEINIINSYKNGDIGYYTTIA